MSMIRAYIVITNLLICLFSMFGYKNYHVDAEYNNQFLERAEQTLDSLYSNYSCKETFLLRENYSSKDNYTATYLASQRPKSPNNPYSYLWPYSGTFSAVSAIMSSDINYKKILDRKVLPGLDEYYDKKRKPYAYSSYISSAPLSDRFYDDNIWLGIDYTDVYMLTHESKYITKARDIWNYIESGIDEKLGGGIYWCEQKKESKNTCSNAPGTVLALKLFIATNDSSLLIKGERLYEWTKSHLQDQNDDLYFDNIGLSGKIGKAKYAYNSGQMMQAASLLYKVTSKKKYLDDAQRIAASCYQYFFTEFLPMNGISFRILKKGDIWFSAVMLRGFIELYHIDRNKTYLNSFIKTLDWAWEKARDEKGLFYTDLSGRVKDNRKWLLTQAAMVEMYARLAKIE